MNDDAELDPGRLASASPELFRARIVELAPGRALRFEAAAWEDAIVFLTAGEIELECRAGQSRRFALGAVLCLSALPLASVRSVGVEPARLVAISRHAPTGASSSG